MMEQNNFLDQVRDNMGLWCGANCVGADLAAAAGTAITNKLRAISILPGAITQLWPWIENTNVKIITRFMVDKSPDDAVMSDLSSRITGAFRDGADGAIVFVRARDMDRFVSELKFVRDDLFFNKTLSVGIDVNEINHDDWENVFGALRAVRADSLTLFLSHDDGDKSDFVGRVYAMLNTDMGDWHGELHFMLGENAARIDQSFRLVEQLRHDTVSKTLFWIDN